jgi:menaquinol-cytochrome c reductase iron-sulfur subunit
MPPQSGEPSRRDFLGRLTTVVLGIATATASAFVPLRALFAVNEKTVQVAPGELALGKLADFSEGRATEVRLHAEERDAWLRQPTEVGSVFVVRAGAGANVLSATCPHLGCPVDYDAASRQFNCPCHRSVFALDGARISGPAPRGLDPLQSSVEGGELRCRFERFAPGLRNRRVI